MTALSAEGRLSIVVSASWTGFLFLAHIAVDLTLAAISWNAVFSPSVSSDLKTNWGSIPPESRTIAALTVAISLLAGIIWSIIAPSLGQRWPRISTTLVATTVGFIGLAAALSFVVPADAYLDYWILVLVPLPGLALIRLALVSVSALIASLIGGGIGRGQRAS